MFCLNTPSATAEYRKNTSPRRALSLPLTHWLTPAATEHYAKNLYAIVLWKANGIKGAGTTATRLQAVVSGSHHSGSHGRNRSLPAVAATRSRANTRHERNHVPVGFSSLSSRLSKRAGTLWTIDVVQNCLSPAVDGPKISAFLVE